MFVSALTVVVRKGDVAGCLWQIRGYISLLRWGAEKSCGAYGKVVRWTGLGFSVVGKISRLQFSGDETFLLVELNS